MNATRREWIETALAISVATPSFAQQTSGVTRYVRYQKGSVTAHGILEGDTVQPIEGELLGSHKRVGSKQKLSEVKLLYPIVPPKILAVGLISQSHRIRKAAGQAGDLFQTWNFFAAPGRSNRNSCRLEEHAL